MVISKRCSLSILGFLVLLLVIGIFASGCEPMLYITVHNQTDKTLQIFFDGETFIDNAAPREEVTSKIDGIYPKYKIVAKDMDGNVVYSVTFTQDDLKGKNYKYDVYFPPKETETESSDNVTGK
ncbi:hypothetical protein ACFLVW_01790 [Chloroflexota bacterium]